MKERQSSVLIVAAAPEDRAALRDALSRDLAAHYVITEAESGLRALEICRALKPDCLILDHDLPDLSGLDTLKELTAEEWESTCAVVALVDAGDAQLAVEAMKSGAHDCLEKGRAGGTELRRAVSQAIEKAEQRRHASARERELIEKNLALEADLAVLRREAAGCGQEEEAWQVARAGAGSSGAVVSHPERAFYNQTEEQLRLLKTAIGQSDESVMITTARLDRPGPQIVYVNPAFTKMTGYAPEEVIGKTPRILQGPKTDRAVLARLREDCKAGKVFHGEAINYRKDGSEFYLEWSIRPVQNERGAVTHFVAIQRDVTERRRIEDALRNSEAQLRAILDHSTAVIFVKDLEGRYLRINHLYEALLGVTETEVKGKTDHDIHAKEVADAVRANDREVIAADRPLQFEEQVDTVDGQRRFISLKFPLYDDSGRPYGVCGIATDITERKRAEVALRESNERLQLALEAADVGTWRVDLRAGLSARDAALNRILGLPENQLTIPVSKMFERIYPSDVPRVNESWERAIRTGLYDEEHRIMRPDGNIIWVRDRGRFFYGPDDEPLYATGALADITKRKQAEGALKMSEERLNIAMHAGGIGMVDWDVRADSLVWSEKYMDIYGLPHGKTSGRYEDWRERVYPEDLPAVEALIWGTLEKKLPHWQVEYRIVRGDNGEVRWIESRHRVFYDAQGAPLRTVGAALDITERKRSEEGLKLGEERLSLALKVGVIGTFDWDIPMDKTFLTEKFCAIFGLPLSKSTCAYEDWRRCVHPSDISDCEANLQDAFEHRLEEWPTKYRILRADTGELRWVESRSRIFYNAQGEPLRVIGTILDITDRILAEEAIRESEARLRQLADAMPQIVYTCGPGGLVDYGNQRWAEYVGVPAEQSIGHKWMEAVHPDDLESAKQRMRESGETGRRFETVYRLRRKDGQYRWHLARAIPIRDAKGRIVKWIGTATDIHDRKEAEAEREVLLTREREARAKAEHSAESIRRLQALIDSALAPLTLDDLLHEMLARIRELLATDSAAILLLTEDGQSLSMRATIGWEENAKGLRVPVGQGVAGSIATSRAPLIVSDISAMDVIDPALRQEARSLIGAPLIIEGQLIGVIHADATRPRGFTEDDMRLLQLAADRVALAIEHARLYEVERQARRQAEEANRMKDEFLTLVSHELRSPLNAILGYAALLRYGGVDAQKVKYAADVIDRSGKAQAQLIDDLLDTARIISGKLRLEVGPVDLVSVIEQAVQTIYPAADAKGILLETNLPSEIGQITGDPSRLQQVIWNLLSNAVKFTPQGGRVVARLERVDPHICITVSDTGKGISPDFLPYVFDRFRQADVSSARRYGGLGLGLALVKYLVELHGGTIEAMSAGDRQGATFVVTLPVRAVATALDEDGGEFVTAKSSGELAGARALVVDDDDDARELITATLTQYGADVVAVSSAAEAYALITETPPQERPDIMVIDIGMPGEDGYSLMRRVRELERERDFYIPAVALTAYGRTKDRIQALMVGFQTHIVKPVDPTELAAVITSLIRGPIALRQ
jgi:PAS domain S-box-containing protein